MLTAAQVMEIQAEFCKPDTLEMRCINRAVKVTYNHDYFKETARYHFSDGSIFTIYRAEEDGAYLGYVAET